MNTQAKHNTSDDKRDASIIASVIGQMNLSPSALVNGCIGAIGVVVATSNVRTDQVADALENAAKYIRAGIPIVHEKGTVQ